MKQFDEYLHQFNEVGVIQRLMQAVVYVTGLPRVKMMEVVMTEEGERGLVLALYEGYVEVLVLSGARLRLGAKVVRTGEQLTMPLAESVLGQVINPLGYPVFEGATSNFSGDKFERRLIDVPPLPLERRENIWDQLETGVSVVDLLVPIGKGQRELVIGDRKIGKTEFLKQVIVSHARKGGVVVYGGIARRTADLLDMKAHLQAQGVDSRVVMVLSLAADPPGLVYLTPFSATATAEFFRDKGMDVLVVLDDMTIHAKYYREMSLLSQKFPGRSAYPGDIFYTHARIMERAGKFDRGSITCLPVAETVMSDLRGYIQTNLMSMTDGHIYFDHELFNQGKRPAVGPFLSVTRVGHQTQSPLLKELSQQVTSFLVHHEKLIKLMHFGEEISGDVKKTLATGEKMLEFFNQPQDVVVPLTISAIFVASIWSGLWDEVETAEMKLKLLGLVERYQKDNQLKTSMDSVVTSCQTVTQLVEAIKPYGQIIRGQ